MRPVLALLLILAVFSSACGDDDEAGVNDGDDGANDGAEALYPDVVGAEVEPEPGGTYRVSATLSSPYDSPERYADAWRVLTPDGRILGIRELTHHHRDEQPFTRSLAGVEIPEDVTEVVVEGRDQQSGWGGATAAAAVPQPAS